MALKKFLMIGVVAGLLVACGDDASDKSPVQVAEVSSSSVDEVLSSSVNVVESSSSFESEGLSSSVEVEESSSSSKRQQSDKSSSSSVSIADQKIPCDMPEHGIYHIGDEEFVCKDGFLVPYVPPSSSSAKVLPFKEKFKIDSVFNEEKTYGTFEDPRDGQIYRTIVIKTKYEQFEVFAQNLNYGTQVKLENIAFDDSKVEKFCYDDDSWYCEHYFGGLYTWSEAMGLPKACDSVWTGTTLNCPDSIAKGIVYDSDWNKLQIQGICPDGWHVMNETEWRAMIRGEESAYRSISIASNGYNENGFSALFGGGAFNSQKECLYDQIGRYGRYWVPKEVSEQAASEIVLYTTDWSFSGLIKIFGLSVRCVKNYTSLYEE